MSGLVRLVLRSGCQKLDLRIENVSQHAGQFEIKAQSSGDDHLRLEVALHVATTSVGCEGHANQAPHDGDLDNPVYDADGNVVGIKWPTGFAQVHRFSSPELAYHQSLRGLEHESTAEREVTP